MEAASLSKNRTTTAQQRVAANNLRKDVDFKAQQELNEMEKMRQQGVEELSKAYEETSEKLVKTERRLQSAKVSSIQRAANRAQHCRANSPPQILLELSPLSQVRVGCLEQDNAKMRDGMKVFVGKASNDDKLVDMLKREVQELKKKLKRGQERETKMREEGASMRGEGTEVELLKNQVSQFKNQNVHQERIINQLRADIHRMRNPGSAKKRVVVRSDNIGHK